MLLTTLYKLLDIGQTDAASITATLALDQSSLSLTYPMRPSGDGLLRTNKDWPHATRTSGSDKSNLMAAKQLLPDGRPPTPMCEVRQ